MFFKCAKFSPKVTGKQKEVAKNIVIALGLIGAVSLIMVAPGLAKAIPYLSRINVSRINQELKRLRKRGLIEIVKRKNGVEVVKLTKEGRKKLARYRIDTLWIDKPDKWDGKWRIIIFDIPVKKNAQRELLRRRIKSLGFYKLQSSVFAYPYPCFEAVKFIRDYFEVSREVVYIEAQRVENQDELVGNFFT